MSKYFLCLLSIWSAALYASEKIQVGDRTYVLEAGHPSLSEWRADPLPDFPKDNPLTLAKIELGKKLFFDKRLSIDGEISCGSCHNPKYGWSDGLETAKGFKGMVLPRATPTIINVAYNTIQNWDGRNTTLEQQATEPITHPDEMHLEMTTLLKRLNQSKDYKRAFEKAFPNEAISKQTVAKAIASFERIVISTNSAFDRWIKGEQEAMTKKQIQGFRVFIDSKKGDCLLCHSGPNFTDNSFHNIGLQSYLKDNPDLGRYKQVPLEVMKGAFKTPTLRNIEQTAPYFHDGSAKTLKEVVVHYQKGGIPNPQLSKNMRPISLSNSEVESLIDFMRALSGEVDVQLGSEVSGITDANY